MGLKIHFQLKFIYIAMTIIYEHLHLILRIISSIMNLALNLNCSILPILYYFQTNIGREMNMNVDLLHLDRCFKNIS